MSSVLIRCFINVGAERIELGYDQKKKEDPLREVQTSAPIDWYEATATIDGVIFKAISETSMKDAIKKLEKKLPEAV